MRDFAPLDPTPPEDEDPAARFELRRYVIATEGAGRAKTATVRFPSGRESRIPFDAVVLNEWPESCRYEIHH